MLFVDANGCYWPCLTLYCPLLVNVIDGCQGLLLAVPNNCYFQLLRRCYDIVAEGIHSSFLEDFISRC